MTLKQKFPATYSETFLIVRNEREIYQDLCPEVEAFLKKIGKYSEGDEDCYRMLLQKICNALSSLFIGHLDGRAAITSLVMNDLCYRYGEEVGLTADEIYNHLDKTQPRYVFETLRHRYQNSRSEKGRSFNDDTSYWINNQLRIQSGIFPSPPPDLHDDQIDAMASAAAKVFSNDFIQPHQTKENTMPVNPTKAVSVVTYVFGKDADTVSDEDVFEHIRKIEDRICSLEAIMQKPLALEKQIKALYLDIDLLVKFSNDRQPKAEST